MPPNGDSLFVPADSQLPSPGIGDKQERGAEYDRYFGIVRGPPDLVSWTRSCLETQRKVLARLADSGLPAERRCELLHGLLLVAHETMECLLSGADERRNDES